jgi:type II secretory pathway pseudopilin PulG
MNFLNKKKLAGFTLVELLTVVSIIILISAITIISLQGARKTERDARRLADIKKIIIALERYRGINNSYPDCSTACDSDGEESSWFTCVGEALLPFLGVIPQDPDSLLGGYCYLQSGEGGNKQISLRYSLEKQNDDADTLGVETYSEEQGKSCFLYTVILQDYR